MYRESLTEPWQNMRLKMEWVLKITQAGIARVSYLDIC